MIKFFQYSIFSFSLRSYNFHRIYSTLVEYFPNLPLKLTLSVFLFDCYWYKFSLIVIPALNVTSAKKYKQQKKEFIDFVTKPKLPWRRFSLTSLKRKKRNINFFFKINLNKFKMLLFPLFDDVIRNLLYGI